jgi:cytochrome c-type biogenesis protein CcmH/NrfG
VQAVLGQARQSLVANNLTGAMQHYQSLIDVSQLLEETRSDLSHLVEANPEEPRLHRMLGDTHMRLGDLQAALDAYRSALDQL